MDADLALVLGVVLGGLSIPSIMSAWSDSRAPRVSALTLLISFGLVLYALNARETGYTMADLPDVFVRVAAKYIP